MTVQRPHGIAHWPVVSIEQEPAAALVASQMDLSHGTGWQFGDEASSIEAVVVRAHEHVVDVEQETSPRARHHLR